jgi:hypothetical protein
MPHPIDLDVAGLVRLAFTASVAAIGLFVFGHRWDAPPFRVVLTLGTTIVRS